MAETRVIIKSFQDTVIKVTGFNESRVIVRSFDDMVVIVPGQGEEEEQEAFDYSLDFDL